MNHMHQSHKNYIDKTSNSDRKRVKYVCVVSASSIDANHVRMPGPLRSLIKAMSLVIRVTRLACNAKRFASDRRETRYVSAASCMHSIAAFCHRYVSPSGCL